MFLDVLDMIFDSFETVINSLKVDLFSVGGVSINLWEIILGLLVLGIIFGFFLAPRYGSGLQGVGNIVGYSNARKARFNKSLEKSKSQKGSSLNNNG